MKPNLFYHSFYILVSFFRGHGSSNIGHSETWHRFLALILLSVCMASNVYSLIMLLELADVIGADLTKWSLVVFFFMIVLNYLLLMNEKKHQAIVRYYDKKYQTKGVTPAKGGVVVYVIFSLAIVVYLADLTRGLLH